MNTAVAAPRPGPFAVLRRRNFSLLSVGQLVSTMGTALAELAASILVYRLTGSAAAVGLMLIAAAGPSVVLGLIAGVYVDRLDRKKILVACDLIRAIAIAFVPLLLVHFGVAALYVAIAFIASVSQFYAPRERQHPPRHRPRRRTRRGERPPGDQRVWVDGSRLRCRRADRRRAAVRSGPLLGRLLLRVLRDLYRLRGGPEAGR